MGYELQCYRGRGQEEQTLSLLTFTEMPGTVSVRLHFDESSTLTANNQHCMSDTKQGQVARKLHTEINLEGPSVLVDRIGNWDLESLPLRIDAHERLDLRALRPNDLNLHIPRRRTLFTNQASATVTLPPTHLLTSNSTSTSTVSPEQLFTVAFSLPLTPACTKCAVASGCTTWSIVGPSSSTLL